MTQFRTTARMLSRIASGVLAALLLVAPVAAKQKGGDGDGMPTGWERRNGLSVQRNDARRDPDTDTLKNLREFREGTDPQDEDTDGDGVPDGEEVADGTDPLGEGDAETDDGLDPEDADDGDEPCGADDPDSEGDGIDDEDEDELEGDVTDPDSDGDGTIDGFEDTDADGETDLVEEQVTPDKCSNHGAAVRTVAHCPVHGRAHGKLVSGIARDKGATVEDAVAACAAALGLDVGEEEPPAEEPPVEEPPVEEPPAEEPPAEEPPA